MKNKVSTHLLGHTTRGPVRHRNPDVRAVLARLFAAAGRVAKRVQVVGENLTRSALLLDCQPETRLPAACFVSQRW